MKGMDKASPIDTVDNVRPGYMAWMGDRLTEVFHQVIERDAIFTVQGKAVGVYCKYGRHEGHG